MEAEWLRIGTKTSPKEDLQWIYQISGNSSTRGMQESPLCSNKTIGRQWVNTFWYTMLQCLACFRKTGAPFPFSQAKCNTIEQSHMNLLCLIGLLAGVWLFNQAVTWEELLLDTPAESRDFIDSPHWLAFLSLIEWLSWIQKGNTLALKAAAGGPSPTETICQSMRKMKVLPKVPSLWAPLPTGPLIAYPKGRTQPLCCMAPQDS